MWRLRGEILLAGGAANGLTAVEAEAAAELRFGLAQEDVQGQPAGLARMSVLADDVAGAAPTYDNAEECFQRAIAVARSQQARMWELRATASLARFLHTNGRTAEAQEVLQDIYSWFNEGFDSNDMRQARKLLAELGSGVA